MFVKFIGTDNVHYTTFKGIADVPMATILCHRDNAAGLERCLLGSMRPDEFHELSVAQSAAMRSAAASERRVHPRTRAKALKKDSF